MRVIGGIKGSRKLKSVKSKSTRPTMDRVRESIFNILGEKVVDSKFLDLFAGSGGIGIEALRRGAKEVFFVENNYKAAKVLKENLANLGFEGESKILKMDFERAVKSMAREGEKFDIVYIDPPYASELSVVSLRLLSVLDILEKDGFILSENFHKDKLDKRFGKLELFRVKKIGDTCVSFFKE